MARFHSRDGYTRSDTYSYFDAGGQHVLEQKHAVLVDWQHH